MSKLYRQWFHSQTQTVQEEIMKYGNKKQKKPVIRQCEIVGCIKPAAHDDFICWDHISQMLQDMADK